MDLLNTDAVVDAVMTYGPIAMKIGLFTFFAYNLWSRNILKSIITGGAFVATFFLGW